MPVVGDYERLAQSHLSRAAWDYYATGSNDMESLRDNLRAFRKYLLRPRILKGISRISTETHLLGYRAQSPLCISPSAMQRMAHPDGELATSRAMAQFHSCMVLSTYSTTALEEVIDQGNPHSSYWFQLYLYQNRPVSAELIRRAEVAGYRALVLTVDTPMVGRRLADARNHFKLPPPWRLANFPDDFQILTASERAAREANGPQLADHLSNESLGNRSDTSLTWQSCLPWLRSVTRLPIILKGVLTRADAALAVQHGCAGVIVSNHGGRQLDGVQASIDALAEVVKGAQGQLEVYFDGGVRCGADVFRAVFIGRPVLWGLAANGQKGVEAILHELQSELEDAMRLTGCATLTDIQAQCLYRTGYPIPSQL
ncbi:Hydroxyacid oxidase 1 [Dimargaris cristalligena]|nr:Hydroxyacid oxidase 1 [Dimargaris cristalligena]